MYYVGLWLPALYNGAKEFSRLLHPTVVTVVRSRGATGSVVGGLTCRPLFIIFILTASALRSRETPPTTFPISFGFFAGRGIGFP
jgi:hypothetical protein